jgi:hypothetical protein
MSNDVVVGLTEAIAALRAELLNALEEGQDQPIQFVLEPIELTLQAAVTKSTNGKIGWSVLGLGGSYQAGSTQTLKLRLTPAVRQEDGTIMTQFYVAGSADAGDRVGAVGNG